MLSAFKHKNVYALYPYNWYTTNIDTAIFNAYAIGKVLYPKEFKDIDLNQIAEEIYTNFVGKNVRSEMEKDYGKILEKITN